MLLTTALKNFQNAFEAFQTTFFKESVDLEVKSMEIKFEVQNIVVNKVVTDLTSSINKLTAVISEEKLDDDNREIVIMSEEIEELEECLRQVGLGSKARSIHTALEKLDMLIAELPSSKPILRLSL